MKERFRNIMATNNYYGNLGLIMKTILTTASYMQLNDKRIHTCIILLGEGVDLFFEKKDENFNPKKINHKTMKMNAITNGSSLLKLAIQCVKAKTTIDL